MIAKKLLKLLQKFFFKLRRRFKIYHRKIKEDLQVWYKFYFEIKQIKQTTYNLPFITSNKN